MSTLSTGALTLTDWGKRLDPNGKTSAVIELLNQSNPVLEDMLLVEGNLPTGHRTTVRTALPSVTWRQLNAGVATSKSTSAQIDAQCGMLEAWSEIDVDLAKLNGNTPEFRLSESKAFIEAMNQEVAQTLFYGNAGLAPEEFTGLAAHYAAISGASNASNVISGSGSGSDNASIYLVGWGSDTVCGIFPKGSMAGLQHDDYGEQTAEVTAGVGGTRMRVLQERYQWKVGLAVRDWRYIVRICNIDISNLIALSTNADLPTLMVKAWHRIPNIGACSPVWYMNRTCAEMLDVIGRNDVRTGGQLNYDVVDGKQFTRFRSIPVRITDALTETEATVS